MAEYRIGFGEGYGLHMLKVFVTGVIDEEVAIGAVEGAGRIGGWENRGLGRRRFRGWELVIGAGRIGGSENRGLGRRRFRGWELVIGAGRRLVGVTTALGRLGTGGRRGSSGPLSLGVAPPQRGGGSGIWGRTAGGCH